jgi:putative exporter of polyketide antibiotics
VSSVHGILFNAHIIYSLALGIWAASMAVRNESISGHFWGAVATYVLLVAVTTLVGIIMALQGLQPRSGRMTVYFLYMAFLLVIMPGLFSLLRGRDDRSAGIAFAVLAFFNASTSISMVTRELSGPWVETP